MEYNNWNVTNNDSIMANINDCLYSNQKYIILNK